MKIKVIGFIDKLLVHTKQNVILTKDIFYYILTGYFVSKMDNKNNKVEHF